MPSQYRAFHSTHCCRIKAIHRRVSTLWTRNAFDFAVPCYALPQWYGRGAYSTKSTAIKPLLGTKRTGKAVDLDRAKSNAKSRVPGTDCTAFAAHLSTAGPRSVPDIA
eukprot:2490514-Rhodomonas_salina.4